MSPEYRGRGESVEHLDYNYELARKVLLDETGSGNVARNHHISYAYNIV
jgi:hypothetical protein